MRKALYDFTFDMLIAPEDTVLLRSESVSSRRSLSLRLGSIVSPMRLYLACACHSCNTVNLNFPVDVVSESLLQVFTVVKKFPDTVQLDSASWFDRVTNEIVLGLGMSQLQCGQPEIAPHVRQTRTCLALGVVEDV